MSKHTPGPWEYVPSNEHHGPYVVSEFGSTICDCYAMSHPAEASTANGGPSKPVNFLHEMADPNARLIAAAPDMLDALRAALSWVKHWQDDVTAGLKPTPASLFDAEREIMKAIERAAP